MTKTKQKIIQNLIDQVQPDLVIFESLFNLPFIMCMKYKWALIASNNPLKISNQIDYPPMGSGVCENFEWYTNTLREFGADFRKKLDEWYEEFGLKRSPSLSHFQASPYFNVCIFPKILNYFNVDSKWLQLNSSVVKDEVNKFVKGQGWTNENEVGKEMLTPEFLAKPGKLVLFSLGTLLSERVDLFNQIMPALANSPNKFIVSKGENGDKFELPPNCVGSNSFNQLELLPLVDVFVTHG